MIKELEAANHGVVNHLLDITKPSRLPSTVLEAMVLHDYFLGQVMPRFTPPDCAKALMVAVENNKTAAVGFLMGFVADNLDVMPLAQRAVYKNAPQTLKILTQGVPEIHKIWLMKRLCLQTAQREKTSLDLFTAAEILLKNIEPQDLIWMLSEATLTPVFQAVCDHMLMLRQKEMLEREVADSNTIAKTRKI